jgi:flagellar motor switch protein FliN/FliY
LLSDPRLELLYSIQLPVSVELGRTTMYIRDILRLGRGSVIEFDRLISDPVDILIDGKKVAEGEVVVIDKHFGIRITTLVEPAERLRGLRR